jgi:hypothetical protein
METQMTTRAKHGTLLFKEMGLDTHQKWMDLQTKRLASHRNQQLRCFPGLRGWVRRRLGLFSLLSNAAVAEIFTASPPALGSEI